MSDDTRVIDVTKTSRLETVVIRLDIATAKELNTILEATGLNTDAMLDLSLALDDVGAVGE